MSQRKINEWALPHVKKFRTYIDIGASVGNTSLPYVNQFEKVIAFEPNPESFRLLSSHLKIQTFNIALANSDDTVFLKIPESTANPEHGSIAPRRNKNWLGVEYQVQCKKLDSYNFLNVDFIKVDVEQGELEVFLGAINTIKSNQPTIMFENKRNENDIVIDLLISLSYKIKKYKSDTIAYIED